MQFSRETKNSIFFCPNIFQILLRKDGGNVFILEIKINFLLISTSKRKNIGCIWIGERETICFRPEGIILLAER